MNFNHLSLCLFVCLMVFNATFNNISDVSWWSVLLVEYPEKITNKLYHIMLYTSPCSRFELTTSVMKGTDWICNCKTIYHTSTATTAPERKWNIIFHNIPTLNRKFPTGGAAYGTPRNSSTLFPKSLDVIFPRTSPYCVCLTTRVVSKQNTEMSTNFKWITYNRNICPCIL